MEMNFLPILVIICLSVCAGYLTAKYVVYPILGYEPAGLSLLKESDITKDAKDTEGSQVQTQSPASGTAASTQAATVQGSTAAPATETTAATTVVPATVIEDQADVKQVAGYALQFGSYSSKAAAEKCINQLKESGINARVLKKDGAYKVIGQLFATKDEAKTELGKMDESVGAFVATIEK